MIKIINKNQCCGCSACESVCSKNAITMKADTLGFYYPHVNTELCVDCGLCDKVCSFNKLQECNSKSFYPLFYAARLKDYSELMRSQSGGVFYAIAKYMLRIGGVIYGVGYDKSFHVKHMRATTIEECESFRGSKYVQSDIRGVFLQILDDLRAGLYVMFTGTPCQASGLYSFIPKKFHDKLVVVDIICHGVPSPKIYEDYLSYLEKKEGDKIIKVNFRDKEMFGWRSAKATFVFSKNPDKKRWFFGKIYNTTTFRECCSVCPYCNTNRISDITIGDFWNSSIPDKFNIDDRGCSNIIVNSNKGNEVFESIRENLLYQQMKREDCMQFNLMTPTALDPNRFSFERMYEQKGFLKAMQHYSDLGLYKQFRLRIGYYKRTILSFLRNFF